MNLTLRQLRAFVAVAETGSFTAAAATLHLTQSALSVLVRELERETGVQLFDRHTRRVVLSDAGRSFQPLIQRLLADLAGAVAELTDLREKKTGLLRLAAPQLMACTLMPRVIAAWRQRYPGVAVNLIDTLPERLLDTLSTGEAELAVGQDVAVDASIERRTLFRDRHWLICPPEHPFANRRKLRWSELEPYTFIAATRDFRQRVMPELSPEVRAYLQRPGTLEVSYMTTALGMVANGLGLTVCPSYSASLVRAHGLRMLRLDAPDFHREVCVYSVADRSLSPAAASFVEMLEAVAVQRDAKGRGRGRGSAPFTSEY